MAIIKCKMCGGDLEVVAESRVAVCEYCGTQQTVPSADNEKKLTLFGRANRLRMACEFDKAAGVYESIVAEFPEEAEAYWGLVLCKYGIEYVDDSATGKKIPTCHRSSFDSVMDDSNLDQALENADVIAQKIYREEAKQFERIRKGILEVSSSEKPYDIFICYKETDEKGDRTLDSVMAQDLYAALTDKGYRVFFSRITLQGKLGEAYEPYIFAALNSAKVMLAVGTCYEYYNAVWVKNEWSRYLKICEVDKSKHLIPCYKDLDPEDMPREFKHLQGADLGKMGAVQDILFNMEKYIPLKKETGKETVVVQQSSKVQALLDRGNMALEDGEWAKADGFFEEVLNNDAKCAWAYVGKTLAQERCKSLDAFVEKRIAIGGEVEREEAIIPLDEVHIQDMVDKYVLKNYLDSGEIRALYQYDRSYVVTASNCEEKYKEAEAYWNNHKMLTRAESFAVGETAEKLRAAKERLFSALRENIQRAKEEDEKAKQALQENYRKFLADADDKAFQLRVDAEAVHLRAIEAKKRAAKRKKITAVIATVTIVAIATVFIVTEVVIPGNKYDEALNMVENGQYEEAMAVFGELKTAGYKDSAEQVTATHYLLASKQLETGDYQNAYDNFVLLKDYKDSSEKVQESGYAYAQALMEEENYKDAVEIFKAIGAYENSVELETQCYLEEAKKQYDRGEYYAAIFWYEKIKEYDKNSEIYIDAQYNYGLEQLAAQEFETAIDAFEKADGYKDAETQLLAAKYGYVRVYNGFRDEKTVYSYLEDLKAADYKDSASIFKERYE